MNEAPMLLLAGIAGVGLGAMFFGGLWWTLRKAMTSKLPALWFASSLLVRTALALLGFYVVSAGNWHQLLACLIGFSAARSAITWMTRSRPSAPREASRAAHS